MKALICISTLLLLMSCGQKSNISTAESKIIEEDSLSEASNLPVSNIAFKQYVVDGIFLKGKVRLFNNDLKNIGELEIARITSVQILEKSAKMYNIQGETDNCEKANFLKVKYVDKDYFVFGQDVYEINSQQKFSIQNEKEEKLILFPITNFKMGASDEDGLTSCDDFSLLVLLNEKKNQYSLMKSPENEDIHDMAVSKYASLFHDDASEEKIYKVTVKRDTLIIGIKAIYQEGGSIFNLKAKLSGKLPETIISDRVRFETEEELKKMDEIE